MRAPRRRWANPSNAIYNSFRWAWGAGARLNAYQVARRLRFGHDATRKALALLYTQGLLRRRWRDAPGRGPDDGYYVYALALSDPRGYDRNRTRTRAQGGPT